jgi:hypothetical protein
MTSPNNFYVNVNTPQTNHTWKRVWDAPDIVTIESVEQELESTVNAHPFTPDPTCPVSLTYFGTGETIPADRYGKPSVDFDTLTICEKMNIYINRETGQMFFLDPKTCTWKALKGEFASTIKWEDVDGKPEVIYNGISHTVITDPQCPENNRLNVSLTELGTPTSDITVTDSNPEITNTDLEGIL